MGIDSRVFAIRNTLYICDRKLIMKKEKNKISTFVIRIGLARILKAFGWGDDFRKYTRNYRKSENRFAEFVRLAWILAQILLRYSKSTDFDQASLSFHRPNAKVISLLDRQFKNWLYFSYLHRAYDNISALDHLRFSMFYNDLKSATTYFFISLSFYSHEVERKKKKSNFLFTSSSERSPPRMQLFHLFCILTNRYSEYTNEANEKKKKIVSSWQITCKAVSSLPRWNTIKICVWIIDENAMSSHPRIHYFLNNVELAFCPTFLPFCYKCGRIFPVTTES